MKSKGFSSDALFDRALKFIEETREEPFFCFISTPATQLRGFTLPARPLQRSKSHRIYSSDAQNLISDVYIFTSVCMNFRRRCFRPTAHRAGSSANIKLSETMMASSMRIMLASPLHIICLLAAPRAAHLHKPCTQVLHSCHTSRRSNRGSRGSHFVAWVRSRCRGVLHSTRARRETVKRTTYCHSTDL